MVSITCHVITRLMENTLHISLHPNSPPPTSVLKSCGKKTRNSTHSLNLHLFQDTIRSNKARPVHLADEYLNTEFLPRPHYSLGPIRQFFEVVGGGEGSFFLLLCYLFYRSGCRRRYKVLFLLFWQPQSLSLNLGVAFIWCYLSILFCVCFMLGVFHFFHFFVM